MNKKLNIHKTKSKTRKKKKIKQINRLTPRVNQLIESFSISIGEIIPATSPMGKGLCFKNIAKSKGLSKYWKDLSNKKRTLSYFFKNIFRYKPIVFRKIIRENISEGINRRHNQGNPVLKKEMSNLVTILKNLKIDMGKELKGLELPETKPTITPPPIEFQRFIKKIGLNPFFDDCIEKFIKGYFKESIRHAFEKIENKIIIMTNSNEVGKRLMSFVFNEDAPKIKVNSPVSANWHSRQEGAKFLGMGSILCFKNPYGHGDEPEISHSNAFYLLCYANYFYEEFLIR